MASCTNRTADLVVTVTPPKAQRNPPPFMVRWMAVTGKAWVKGSVVYTDCGCFLAIQDTMWSPHANRADTGWVPVEWDKITPKLLELSCGCAFIFPEAVRPTASEDCNQSMNAVLYKQNTVLCENGKLYVALKDKIAFDPSVKTDWCGGFTADQIIGHTIKQLCSSQTGDLG